MKVIKNLHAYVWGGRDNNCNTYVFARAFDTNKHVVIDPGHITTPSLNEPGLERLYAEMKKDGLDPDAIGMVVITHCHPDHCEAAVAIREDKKALVVLHEVETDFYSSYLGGRVDLFADEGDIELGAKSPVHLKVFHSPGHSPGHITLYWPDEKALIAGDVIFYRGTGRVDLPGGSGRQLRESIDRLSQLEIEYLLCGHPYGHPGIIVGKREVADNFDSIKHRIF